MTAAFAPAKPKADSPLTPTFLPLRIGNVDAARIANFSVVQLLEPEIQNPSFINVLAMASKAKADGSA
jgi:hypothetical protein